MLVVVCAPFLRGGPVLPVSMRPGKDRNAPDGAKSPRSFGEAGPFVVLGGG